MNSSESVAVGDRDLHLYVRAPDTDSTPGVLLIHPWWGFNRFMRDVCDQVAESGLLVVAPDLYRGDVAATIEEAEAIESAFDYGRAVEDVSAAFQYLREHPGTGDTIGVIGFSMGVYFALKMVQNHPAEVDAAVLFYGTSDGDYADTTTSFLGHFAEHDQFDTPSDVDALRTRLEAGAGSVTFHTYPDTEHWFFEADRPEYEEEAAELAWSRTVDFLRTVL